MMMKHGLNLILDFLIFFLSFCIKLFFFLSFIYIYIYMLLFITPEDCKHIFICSISVGQVKYYVMLA